MLQVQGNVPDERLNESLLQPELFLSLVKSFILDLKARQFSQEGFQAFSKDICAGISELPVEKSLSGASDGC